MSEIHMNLDEWESLHLDAIKKVDENLKDFAGEELQILQDHSALHSRICVLIHALREKNEKLKIATEALEKYASMKYEIHSNDGNREHIIHLEGPAKEALQKIRREG